MWTFVCFLEVLKACRILPPFRGTIGGLHPGTRLLSLIWAWERCSQVLSPAAALFTTPGQGYHQSRGGDGPGPPATDATAPQELQLIRNDWETMLELGPEGCTDPGDTGRSPHLTSAVQTPAAETQVRTSTLLSHTAGYSPLSMGEFLPQPKVCIGTMASEAMVLEQRKLVCHLWWSSPPLWRSLNILGFCSWLWEDQSMRQIGAVFAVIWFID